MECGGSSRYEDREQELWKTQWLTQFAVLVDVSIRTVPYFLLSSCQECGQRQPRSQEIGLHLLGSSCGGGAGSGTTVHQRDPEIADRFKPTGSNNGASDHVGNPGSGDQPDCVAGHQERMWGYESTRAQSGRFGYSKMLSIGPEHAATTDGLS